MSKLAAAYAMKKRAKRPMPKMEDSEMEDSDFDKSQLHPADKDLNQRVAGGVVERIMQKRYSEGGMVANDVGVAEADKLPAEYDDLVLRDDLEFSYDGANSGDELGNEQKDEDERDVVSRIMKSRAKKDRMPRPA